MAMLELQEKRHLEPKKTWQRPLKEYKSATAAAAETFYIDIPRDHFIHEILIHVGEGLTDASPGTLADDLVDIKLVGNGNKYLKDAFSLAPFFIQVERMNQRRHVTGVYHLVFSDPNIPEAKPLPAWIFTSLQLILLDNAPDASNFHFINVTIVESAYADEDLGDWKILVEKVSSWSHFGGNTGWQDKEHERAYKIFSYIYAFDDDGTLSDTVFTKLKLLGRHPKGENIIADEVLIPVLQAENKGTIHEDIDVGYAFFQWAKGFPTKDFSSLYSKLYIPTTGTNISVRVMERYIL